MASDGCWQCVCVCDVGRVRGLAVSTMPGCGVSPSWSLLYLWGERIPVPQVQVRQSLIANTHTHYLLEFYAVNATHHSNCECFAYLSRTDMCVYTSSLMFTMFHSYVCVRVCVCVCVHMV